MPSKPWTFLPGTKAESSKVNQNFDDIYNAYNAHELAAILPHLDGSVTNVKLAADSVTNDKISNAAIKEGKMFEPFWFRNQYVINCLNVAFEEKEITGTFSNEVVERTMADQRRGWVPENAKTVAGLILAGIIRNGGGTVSSRQMRIRAAYWDGNQWVWENVTNGYIAVGGSVDLVPDSNGFNWTPSAAIKGKQVKFEVNMRATLDGTFSGLTDDLFYREKGFLLRVSALNSDA